MKYQQDIPENMMKVIMSRANSLTIVGGFAGLIGPGIDIPVIFPVWVEMTATLAGMAGHAMSNQTIKKVAMAVLTGSGAFLAGSKVATIALGWIGALFTGGLSLVLSAGANATLNRTITISYGKAVARFFLTTAEITDSEMMSKAVLGMVGVDFGISTP
jgi:hypothetical protein